jgi:hypothetical protein
MGPGRIGPGKIGRRRPGGPSAKGLNLEGGGASGAGRDPSMIPKGHGVFGRIPNVDKDGDPFTRRSPHKKPGNNSFF